MTHIGYVSFFDELDKIAAETPMPASKPKRTLTFGTKELHGALVDRYRQESIPHMRRTGDARGTVMGGLSGAALGGALGYGAGGLLKIPRPLSAAAGAALSSTGGILAGKVLGRRWGERKAVKNMLVDRQKQRIDQKLRGSRGLAGISLNSTMRKQSSLEPDSIPVTKARVGQAIKNLAPIGGGILLGSIVGGLADHLLLPRIPLNKIPPHIRSMISGGLGTAAGISLNSMVRQAHKLTNKAEEDYQARKQGIGVED